MEPTAVTIDLCDHDGPPGVAEEVRKRHQRLEPHLDFLARLAGHLDDHDEQALRSLLAAQHRIVSGLRHELRDLAVGDLNGQVPREAVRQRLYELTALLRSLLAQETAVCLPLLDPVDHSQR